MGIFARSRLPLALALAAGLGPWRGADAAEGPAFRFVHLSDTHCARASTNPPSRYLLDPMAKDLVASFDLVEAAVRDINEHVKPRFVIVTGDLVDRPGDAALRRVKSLLDRLRCPYYPVVGNHDGRTSWTRVFGAARLNYTVTVAGWRLIALDSSRGRIEPPAVAWLRRQLDADRTTPTALLTHYPMVLPRAHVAVGKAVYGTRRLVLANAAEVRRAIERRANVRAVFAGHCHIPVQAEAAGIGHYTAPALVALGHHYAVVAVRGHTITTTYRAVGPGVAADAQRRP